ncbi:MAG: peptidylprolyl isomerase [Clostridia bacterium]|nr:peptidylprolyl isomerase [Clostridia bacterium]
MNHQTCLPSAGETVAVIHTTKGDISVKFFPDKAPKTVENFLTHAKNGYYNGIIFHRVIPDFMIQGGDPTGTGMGGESIWGKPFPDEFSRELFNLRGALSMANSGPNTNGSQFFIVQASSVDPRMMQQVRQFYPEEIANEYAELGGTPWLDFRHTVFGQVYEGMDVVDAICNAPRNGNDKPLEEISIQSVDVLSYQG